MLSLLTALTLTIQDDAWARLPEPVTNNAVAGLELDGQLMAYSFAGLHEGKTWRDVTADAYACNLTVRTCREIDGLPDGIGRLASVAVTVRGQIYIFGGYTVAEDHSERSTPEVWRFDPASETYTHITDIPVPVDDTVALVHQDRYIYLVSGWHDTDNVDLVQVYDVEEDRWFEATPFPGAPVFGHAGAINRDNVIHVCGGTRVVPPPGPGERRSFAATADCWLGSLGDDPSQIEWSAGIDVPNGAFYRGAAYRDSRAIVFVAGTDNAYNYNGIGYNGEPSEPRSDTLTFIPRPADLRECEAPRIRADRTAPIGRWGTHEGIRFMDIRGVVQGNIHANTRTFALGGMGANQTVRDTVVELPRIVMAAEDTVLYALICVDPPVDLPEPN